jgi:hypothetical protein
MSLGSPSNIFVTPFQMIVTNYVQQLSVMIKVFETNRRLTYSYLVNGKC